MARTKARDRNGDQKNAKKEGGRKLDTENKKRKRDVQKSAKPSKRAKIAKDEGPLKLPPAKTAKENTKGIEKDPASLEEEDNFVQPGIGDPSTIDTSNNTTSLNITNTGTDTELARTHEVTSMSIISSSHIQQKVTRTLSLLSVYPTVPPAKPAVVMLHSKAKAASKMISIAEIAKRGIAKDGGKWFQYSKVGQIMQEQKQSKSTKENEDRSENRKGKGREDGDEEMGDLDEDDKMGSDEEAFETMKTPFERAIEGKAKVQAVPVMAIYLSRVRVESLRREYGYAFPSNVFVMIASHPLDFFYLILIIR